MAHRFGHGNAHRALERVVVVNAEARSLVEARAVIGREDVGVGEMRLQQDVAGGIAHHVGEIFIALAQRAEALGSAVILAVHDVVDGERQQALGGFLERGIEDLVDLAAQQECRHRGGGDPQQGEQQAERDAEACLQAQGFPHGTPSR